MYRGEEASNGKKNTVRLPQRLRWITNCKVCTLPFHSASFVCLVILLGRNDDEVSAKLLSRLGAGVLQSLFHARTPSACNSPYLHAFKNCPATHASLCATHFEGSYAQVPTKSACIGDDAP